LEDYAQGKASDPFLRCALKPVEQLTEDEQSFLLQYFFQANAHRMIHRYPQYGALYDAWLAAGQNATRAPVLRRRFLPRSASSVATGVVRRRVPRTWSLLGRKQQEAIEKVLPIYGEFARRGQIEISITPFYHPILPLLCDTQIAEISHPYVALPSRFRYPDDARHQLRTAREYVETAIGVAPAGLWPPEGSVSDEALGIAAETGFAWFAMDNSVLARTLDHPAGAEETYRPYIWQ
jgi:alpha-amylase/alpha-mannosidase (GH57 family)